MNKYATFVIGVAVGIAAGIGGTYIFMKKDKEKAVEEEASYWRERIHKSEKNEESELEEDDLEEDSDENPRPEDKIDSNVGVKKYHRPVKKDLDNAYSNAIENIKKEIDMTENERAAELDPSTDPVPGISEISEDEYTTDQGYRKESLQYWCGDDVLMRLNSDGTTGDSADDYFRSEYKADIREEVVGKFLRWAPDYIHGDDSDGWIYIKNENLNVEIEIEIFEGMYQPDFVETEE